MDNVIFITDENGIERKLTILLTYQSNNKDYVLVQKEEDDENVYAFSYDEKGNLFPVESEEEEKVALDVLFAFQEDEENA